MLYCFNCNALQININITKPKCIVYICLNICHIFALLFALKFNKFCCINDKHLNHLEAHRPVPLQCV